MRKHVVIDTNVLLVASQKAEQASQDCVRNCVNELDQVRLACCLLLDSGYRILKEYLNKNSPTGEPCVGDAFLKWILKNQANPEQCEFVEITPRNDSVDDFHEFPDDPALASFDRSDRKFVAVARASQHRPAILNATDSDWCHHREVLEKHGVVIDFLCPDQFNSN